MTEAQKKAKDLCDDFFIEIGNESLWEIKDIKSLKFLSKQCAIIAVDEIIKEYNSLHEYGMKDVHMSMNTPKKTYTDIIKPKIEFWQKVRKEIEKL